MYLNSFYQNLVVKSDFLPLQSRNEINNEQEAQLEFQKTSLQQKRKELQELDKKINLLGHQLHPSGNESDASTSSELMNGDLNGNSKFGSKNLFDTLQKKKVSDKILKRDFQVLPDFNRKANAISSSNVPYTRRGNFYVAPDGREFDRPPTAEDYPQFITGSLTNLPSLDSPTRIPVRSASSDALSALRGSSPHLPRSRTDVHPLLQVNTTNVQLNSQQKNAVTSPSSPYQQSQSDVKFNFRSPTASLSSLSSVIPVGADTTKSLTGFANEGRKHIEQEIWTESSDFRTSSPISSEKIESRAFNDAHLSKCLDMCSGTVFRYLDSPKSDCTESLIFQNNITSKQIILIPEEKHTEDAGELCLKLDNEEKPPPLPRKASKLPELPKKPPVAPKPSLPPKKSKQLGLEANGKELTIENTHDSHAENISNFSHARQPNVSDSSFAGLDEIREPVSDGGMNGELNDNDYGYPSGMNEMQPDFSTFADIDIISETQNDLLPYLSRMISEQPSEPVEQPTEEDTSPPVSESEVVLLPVVISVPPDKMPPTILKKPGRDNKKRGRIQLDPHALLLDAALEGEVALVQDMVHRVPDPSFANAEGITPLHNAVCGNHKNVVRLLVEIGCDINSPDNNGWYVLS